MQQNNQKDSTKLLSTTSLTSSNFNFRSKTLVESLFCASVINYILQGWDFNLSWKFSLISLAIFMDITVIISAILLLDPERTNFHFSGNELKFEGLTHIVTNIINLGLQNLLSPLLTLVFAERGKETAKLTIEGMAGVAISFNILETWLYLHYYKEARAIKIENDQLALRKIRVLAHNADVFVTSSLQTLAMVLYEGMSWGLLTKIEISDKNRLTVIENLDYSARGLAWVIRLAAINNIALAAEIVADLPLASWSLNRVGIAGSPVTIVEKSQVLKDIEKCFHQLKEIFQLVKDFGEKVVTKAIHAIENFASDTLNKMESFLQDVREGSIISLIEDGFAKFKESLEDAKNELQNQLQNKASALENLIKENLSLKALQNSLDEECQNLKNALEKVHQKIQDFTKEVEDKASEIAKQIQENEILKKTVDECKAIEAKLRESWSKLKQEKNKCEEQLRNDLVFMRKVAVNKIKSLKEQISSTVVKGVGAIVEDLEEAGNFIVESVRISSKMIEQSTQTEEVEITSKEEKGDEQKEIVDQSNQTSLEQPHSRVLELVDPLHVFHSGNSNHASSSNDGGSKGQEKKANSKNTNTGSSADGKKHALYKNEADNKQNDSKAINYFSEYKIKEANFTLAVTKKLQDMPYDKDKEQEDLAKEAIKNLEMENLLRIKQSNHSEILEINEYYKAYNMEVPLLVADTKFPADAW